MNLHKQNIIIMVVILSLLICLPTIAEDFTTNVPNEYGTLHTYTVWDSIKWGGNCRELINFSKEKGILNNKNGIVSCGEFWCGALTTTYGRVGDMLLVIEAEDYIYPVVMFDTKNQQDRGCNKYGHKNGKCVVEFEILSKKRKELYGSSGGFISDKLNLPIKKVINIGSIYEHNNHTLDPYKACEDRGLYGYKLLINPYEYIIITKPPSDNLNNIEGMQCCEILPDKRPENFAFKHHFITYYNLFNYSLFN